MTIELVEGNVIVVPVGFWIATSATPSVDYANTLIYSFDGTAGKLVAIKLDTTTVLVVTNISTSLNQQQMIMQVLNPPPSVWKEQII